MIRVQSLSYSYPNTEHPILRDIELHIPAGQFCGIVGPNAAGKSTLCYALSGFIPHYFRGNVVGEVIIDDRDITKTPLSKMAGDIGLVFQNPFNQITWARFTIREEVAFGLENLGVPRPEMEERVEQVLLQTGLIDLADRSPYTLSGGQQQRLALASIIVMRPRVLVLDEPTSQLDPFGTREVFEAVYNLVGSGDMTVVIVEHKLEWLATFADRILLLNEGRILADGTPREVLTSMEAVQVGIRTTSFTRAARLAETRGLTTGKKSLPVTLEQAQAFFR